ncbi:MAG: type transport system permease protein [Thermomicrobiales bacterium]|nr:type transport system permease protein [Thermomicrobiales bacterium]
MKGLPVVVAFLRRDWAIARSYRLSYVLDLFSSLTQLTIFFSIGRLFDRADISADGALARGYFSFAVIGLVVQTLVIPAVTSLAYRLQTEQTTGSFEALLTTPPAPALLMLCSAAYDFIRAAISAVLLLVVAWLLFGLSLDTSPTSILVAVVAFLGIVVLFAAVGIVVAAVAVVVKRASAFSGLVTEMLTLCMGVYFPLSVLPGPLRIAAETLPFSWGIGVLRAALLNDRPQIGRLVMALAVAALLLVVAVRIFNLAVERAKRSGSLAQY